MQDFIGSGPSQLGLDLGDDVPPPSCEPDREEVRLELLEILATAKAAIDKVPWDDRTFMYHKVVFPQMANWLPEELRDRLRREFAVEVRRLEGMIAA